MPFRSPPPKRYCKQFFTEDMSVAADGLEAASALGARAGCITVPGPTVPVISHRMLNCQMDTHTHGHALDRRRGYYFSPAT